MFGSTLYISSACYMLRPSSPTLPDRPNNFRGKLNFVTSQHATFTIFLFISPLLGSNVLFHMLCSDTLLGACDSTKARVNTNYYVTTNMSLHAFDK